MQAIHTKYFGPTNHKGSRIKATASRGSITVSYPHDLSGDDVHTFAVKQLVERFCMSDELEYGTPPEGNPWARPFVSGTLPDGSMAHVYTT